MKLSETGFTAQDIKDKAKKYMIETYERFDFLADSAKGVYMYDEKGTPYLDFYAGIAVNSVGNCCERVVDAVCEQAKTIMQSFNYPYTVPQALLAEKVCTTLGMDKIFYQNTGTEANEAMIKMARKYGAFHTGTCKAVYDSVKQTGFFGTAPAGNNESLFSVSRGDFPDLVCLAASEDEVHRKMILKIH